MFFWNFFLELFWFPVHGQTQNTDCVKVEKEFGYFAVCFKCLFEKWNKTRGGTDGHWGTAWSHRGKQEACNASVKRQDHGTCTQNSILYDIFYFRLRGVRKEAKDEIHLIYL